MPRLCCLIKLIQAQIRRNGPLRFRALLPLILAALMISGCAVLPMKNLQPVIAPPTAGACGGGLARAGKGPSFRYVLPGETTTGGAPQIEMVTTNGFEEYDTAIQNRLASKLPPALAQHRVTVAFREFLTSVTGEAQFVAQTVGSDKNSPEIARERALIQKHNRTPNLKHSELKDFANKLFALQLLHGPDDYSAITSSNTKIDTTLVAYLKAYYDGKFYDRMGTAISKPQIPSLSSVLTANRQSNFSIPDSEIVAAETVLLEFMIDCIDPTPVMGDKDNHPAGTTYYPGNSTDQPTALATGNAVYVTLPPEGCGINLKNVWVLKDLANAASDQAAAVDGLVVNTPGGISIGLGVLGKISIGDNQTLSDLLKTAASDLALRAALAASYLTLRDVNFNPVPVPP